MNKAKILELIKHIQENLTDDLRLPKYRGPNKMSGYCYVASEALYHLLDRKPTPMQIKHNGISHWYLMIDNEVVDITVEQFDTVPDYMKGRRRGFLTSAPSKRAQKLMDKL